MTSILSKINDLFQTGPTTTPASLLFRSKPAEAGDSFNSFYLKVEQGYWEGRPTFIKNQDTITDKQLFKKPLVLAFYSPEWGDYGLQQLKTLNALQQDINLLGGQLLVVADTDLRTLRRLILENNLKLNIYSDPSFTIAENFGVYNAADPVYNRISGIDKNAPLLATYVVSPEKKVSFKYIDSLSDGFPTTAVLSAVITAGGTGRSRVTLPNYQ
jgi:peroxiredoxin